jgi:hypothetical protein
MSRGMVLNRSSRPLALLVDETARRSISPTLPATSLFCSETCFHPQLHGFSLVARSLLDPEHLSGSAVMSTSIPQARHKCMGSLFMHNKALLIMCLAENVDLKFDPVPPETKP